MPVSASPSASAGVVERARYLWATSTVVRVAVVLVGLLVAGLIYGAGRSAYEAVTVKGDVRESCEEYVSSSLRSPGSAEFLEPEIEARGEFGYDVTGEVDAENGFGALLRLDYTCQVNKVGDSWLLIDLQVDEQ